jgi:hypothetical protein
MQAEIPKKERNHEKEKKGNERGVSIHDGYQTPHPYVVEIVVVISLVDVCAGR